MTRSLRIPEVHKTCSKNVSRQPKQILSPICKMLETSWAKIYSTLWPRKTKSSKRKNRGTNLREILSRFRFKNHLRNPPPKRRANPTIKHLKCSDLRRRRGKMRLRPKESAIEKELRSGKRNRGKKSNKFANVKSTKKRTKSNKLEISKPKLRSKINWSLNLISNRKLSTWVIFLWQLWANRKIAMTTEWKWSWSPTSTKIASSNTIAGTIRSMTSLRLKMRRIIHFCASSKRTRKVLLTE